MKHFKVNFDLINFNEYLKIEEELYELYETNGDSNLIYKLEVDLINRRKNYKNFEKSLSKKNNRNFAIKTYYELNSRKNV